MGKFILLKSNCILFVSKNFNVDQDLHFNLMLALPQRG